MKVMNANSYVRVKDVAKELDISEGMAYKIIRKLNKELNDQGYVTVRALWFLKMKNTKMGS